MAPPPPPPGPSTSITQARPLRHRTHHRQPQSGSQTHTVSLPSSGRLTLRGQAENNPAQNPSTSESREPRVLWAEDVVDNENLGRKSSKVCCIYHRPHDPDQSGGSSSDNSSDSTSDSGGEDDSSGAEDLSRAGPVRRSRASTGRRNLHRRQHGDHDHHGHDHDCGREHGADDDEVQRSDGAGEAAGHKATKKTRNAYERIPRYTPAGKKQAEQG